MPTQNGNDWDSCQIEELFETAGVTRHVHNHFARVGHQVFWETLLVSGKAEPEVEQEAWEKAIDVLSHRVKKLDTSWAKCLHSEGLQLMEHRIDADLFRETDQAKNRNSGLHMPKRRSRS